MERKFGCTREVFLIGRYAIKVPQYHYGWPYFLQGLLANIQEVTFSKIKDKRLCPILFYIPGGWLVVMPRCEEIYEPDFKKLDLKEFFQDNHQSNEYALPVENKPDSFGILNGKVVAIDYGS